MIAINGISRLVFVIQTHRLFFFRELGTEFLNVGRLSDVNFLKLIEIVNCLPLVFSNLREALIERRFPQNDSPLSTDFILGSVSSPLCV